MVVYCTECKDDHFVEHLEILDVHEDAQGAVSVMFICPVTQKTLESNVYAK
jgi:hypothetical protein